MQKNNGNILEFSLDQKIEIIFNLSLWRTVITNEKSIRNQQCVNDFFVDNGQFSFLNDFYSLSATANSWNEEAMALAANTLVSDIRKKQSNVFFLPILVTDEKAFVPLSEDSFLSNQLLNPFLSCLHDHKILIIGTILENISSKNSNLPYIFELFETINNNHVDCIILRNPVIAEYLQSDFGYEGLIIIESIDAKGATNYSLYSEVTKKYSNKVELKKAVLRYDTYRKNIENNTLDVNVMKVAAKKTIIVSEKEINKLVDKIKRFMQRYYGNIQLEQDVNTFNSVLMEKQENVDMKKPCYEEKIVLVKNKSNILPLSNTTKIAFIGDYGHFNNDIRIFSENFPHYCGTYNDLDLLANNNHIDHKELINFNQADMVVLKINEQENPHEISPLEIELIQQLTKNEKKVIVILPISIQKTQSKWVKQSSVIMIAQLIDKMSLQTLFNILLGISTPSGKTTYALYDSELSSTINRPFIQYPFGYGLSFAQFEYANLRINKNYLQFTLTNSSQVDGYETIQLYARSDKAVDLNVKTLIDFKKVFLRAQEVKLIEMPFLNDEGQFHRAQDYQWKDNRYMTIEVASSKNNVALYTRVKKKYLLNKIDESIDNMEDNTKKQVSSHSVKRVSRISQLITLLKSCFDKMLFKDRVNNKNDQKNIDEPVENKVAITNKKVEPQVVKKLSGVSWIIVLLTIYYDITLLRFLRYVSRWDHNLLILLFLIAINVMAFKLIKKTRYVSEETLNQNITPMLHLMENVDCLEPSNVEVYLVDDQNEEVESFSSDELVNEYMVDENTINEATQELEELPIDNGFVKEEISDEIVRPNEIINQQEVFSNDIDFNEFCDDLCQFLTDHGLKIEKRAAREIFSCMAASHLVLFKDISPKMSRYFLEVFTNFIGGYYFSDTLNEESETFNDVLNEEQLTPLSKCFVSAKQNSNQIHIMEFSDIDLSRVNQNLSAIISYATNPLLPCKINSGVNMVEFDIPKNVWFVLTPASFKIAEMSIPLINCAMTIDINAQIVEPKDSVYNTVNKLSYHYFSDCIRDSRESYYIKEDLWKKFDQLEYYANERTPFVINNRVFRQLERYTTMYLLCEGDEYEAIDSVLTSKLLVMISKVNIVKKDKEDEGIFALCEKLFGLENLTKSKKLLKQIEERI